MGDRDKFSNLFSRDAAAYARDVNVVDHYLEIASGFLSRSRGLTPEEAREFIVKNLRKDGAFPFHDPVVTFLERQDNGDREKKQTTLTRYIGTSLNNRELIAPTFTTYVHPEETASMLSTMVEDNIKLRNVAKKAMFAAKAAKESVLADVKKIEQTGRKLANNAISGAHVSASTPLFNKTAHSTLTSTCRTTSGYGNANNEKFLSGNRHYYSAEIVLNNLATITQNVDYAAIAATMARWQLHAPTVDETMSVIEHSTGLYWWDTRRMAQIRDYVEKLTDLERAAFVYVGDAWHLMRFNPEMVRALLTKLSNKVTGTHPDPDAVMKKAPESYVNLAHQICTKETEGIGKDYDKIRGTEKFHTLALTVENIADTVVEYVDLIEAFWMTDNLPASVAWFPNSVRRSALTSDTDSTIFTVQDWVIWYSGAPSYDERSMSVYAAVVFLAASTITHVLATMSANFGIIDKNLFKIAMKSEYSFPVFVPTQLGKHYFAAISCQEGDVHEELEYEIKGAQLKSANAPRDIIAAANFMMQAIIGTVMEGKKISLAYWLTYVADEERKIINSIRAGELKYLRNSSIKDATSYAGEKEDSPYANHFLWQEVFGPKYGAMPAPPYNTKKISIDAGTPTKMKAWLAAIEDTELRERLMNYLVRNDKKNMTTLHLPVDILTAQGLPKEVEQVVDYEKIVGDIVRILYILLECLGYFAMGDRVKKLVSMNGW